MECPYCCQHIPVSNVAVAIDEGQEPFCRCHVCRKLIRVVLVEADDEEDDLGLGRDGLRHGPTYA